jgi:hypothetical protein
VSFQDIIDSETDIRSQQPVNLMVDDRVIKPPCLSFVRAEIMGMGFRDEVDNANDRHGHTFAPWGKQPSPSVYDFNSRACFQHKEKAAVMRSRDISRADLDRIRIAVHIQRWI